jgi:hypothetical protein
MASPSLFLYMLASALFCCYISLSSERLMIATNSSVIFCYCHICQASFQHSNWTPPMLDASAHSLEHALVHFPDFTFSIVHVLQYTPYDVTPPTTALQRLWYKSSWLPSGGSNWIGNEFIGLGLFLLKGVVQNLGAVGHYRSGRRWESRQCCGGGRSLAKVNN